MKEASEETSKRSLADKQDKPLREPRSTSSLRNLSSPNLTPFPASSSKTAAGVDAFDVIVQASNPSHPQHSAWVERYGGSMRNTRKSIDGSSTSHQASASSTSQPTSVRRTRSRTASKAGTNRSNSHVKSRPALKDVMMVPDTSVWTLLAHQGDALDESDRSHNRQKMSGQEKSADETTLGEVQQESNEKSGIRSPSSIGLDSDAIAPGSSVKTATSDRGQRRKRKKEKGKGRAAAPPVPPPRTTSHAAFHEQIQDTPNPNEDDYAIGSGGASTSPTSLPYLSKSSFDANRPLQSQNPVSSQDLSPRLADDARLRYEDRMGSIDERGMDVHSPSLLSPTTGGTFPLRQSSVSPEIAQGSPTSTSSSPQFNRSIFANLTHSLPGRRSIDFRLPDDDLVKFRQENAKTQRRGLDALFSPLRSAVAGRRAEKQASAISSLPLQSDARKPLPILRVGTPSRASVDIVQRVAPTPPPRSPLRRTPIINQVEEESSFDSGPRSERGPKNLNEIAATVTTPSTTTTTIEENKPIGADMKNVLQKEPVKEMTDISFGQDTSKRNTTALAALQSQIQQPSIPFVQATTSADTTAQSQKTFVSLPKTASHSRSFSMDTEDGQEFHDAISDEGGLGSSDDAKPKLKASGSNPSTMKKRRSRHKSIEDINAARLQAKEAALTEPLPIANKKSEDVAYDSELKQRRDSSASEEMVSTAVVSKESLRRKTSKKQMKSPTNKKIGSQPSKYTSPKMELLDDKMVKDQTNRQSSATITCTNLSKNGAKEDVGYLDARRKTVTQSSLDVIGANHNNTIGSEVAVPKELPNLPIETFSAAPSMMQNGSQQHKIGHSTSHNAHELTENHRAVNSKVGGIVDTDYKQLPLPPPPPPSSLPISPLSDENLKRQIAYQRSYSRMNQNQSGNQGGKISGVFSRMRREKTPSYPLLPGSDSHSTSLTGSTSQLNVVSPSQSPVQDDRNSGIGLGIDTASIPSSKGTNISEQHYPGSPSPQQSVRSPTSEGGWRTRLPSFSASKAGRVHKSERSRAESTQSPPPIPRQKSHDQIQRQQLLYEAVAQSMGENVMAQRAVAPSSTIHKSLSPALLTEERHEADEVGSFIGSEEAEEERLADSKRGTWNSFSQFELAPNKVYDASGEMSNSTSTQAPTIDIQGPMSTSIPKSNTTPSNLTSGTFSSPMTPQINEPNSHLRPSRSFSPDAMHLSMTARRLSRSSSNPKFQTVPQALDLSPQKAHAVRRVESPSDGMDFESYDDSRTSPFLNKSPGREAFGSLSFPSSPGQSPLTGNGNEPKRSRNLSIGSTLLGNITGSNSNGIGSNVIKSRSSFAMDRDRSPVVNQAWADLPPSPSPRSSAVRKFFNSSVKSPLRPGKMATASMNALRSPGRPSFQGESPNDGSFPVSPALPSGQSAMFADHWKTESSKSNGNMQTGMAIGSNSQIVASGYPLTQSASTSSSLQQVSISSQDHSSSQSSSPIVQLRQAGIPRGISTSRLHSPSSLNEGAQKDWITNNGSFGVSGTGSSTNTESVHSNLSSRNITSQRMIDSSSASQMGTATNEADLQAFGRMLRESAKEDAQRVRQIAQRSVSTNNTPNLT